MHEKTNSEYYELPGRRHFFYPEDVEEVRDKVIEKVLASHKITL